MGIKMKEIIFVVEKDIEGGFTARALGYSIFTQADDIEALKKKHQGRFEMPF
jgi:hypothetical protein